MVFKKGNMIVLQNENQEKICLYPEFFTTALSFSSNNRKDITINIDKSDKQNYNYFKKFLDDAMEHKLSYFNESDKNFVSSLCRKISFDSDVLINDVSNKLSIEEVEGKIIIKLIYNTKENFNSVKILSPYFDGNANLEMYLLLLNLYNDIIEQKKLENNQKNKVKKYN